MTASDFDSTGTKSFRRQYPEGNNFAVAHDMDRSFRRIYGAAELEFFSLPPLIEALSVASPVAERVTLTADRDRRARRGKGLGKKP